MATPAGPTSNLASAEARVATEAQYRVLTESIPVQVWTALPDGKLDYVTHQTAHHLGLTPSQLLADGWQNVVHPEDLPRAIERWVRALETGETYEVEFRLKLRSGAYGWHLARAVPQRDEDGAIVRWFGTNTDIEEARAQRRRIQGLLEEVESQAAQLKEQNHLLTLEAEVGAALTRAGSLTEALGVCAQAVVRHLDAAFARIWTTNDAGALLELQASAGMYTHVDGPHGRVPVGQLKIGQIAAERQPHLTNQVIGDPRVADQAWAAREGMVAFAGYPLLLGDRLVGVIAAFARRPLSGASITALGSVAHSLAQAIERRRSEESVRVSARWLSTTLSSIGDGVIATDPEGRITFMNSVAAALTGWAAADAAGLGLGDVFPIVHESTRAVVESPVAKALREGTVVGLAHPTVLLRRDGTEIAIDDSAAPIRDEGGALIGVVLVFRDASDKRRSESERARLLAEEQRSRRDAEEARARAELANRAKEEFLATASHELRTPLSAILGWARTLRGRNLDAGMFLRGVEAIERNAKVQVQLIEDILDGSRIVTGKLHLEICDVDLGRVVEAALEAVRPAASAKGLRLDLVLDRAGAPMRGDPDRLQQIVWNLVNNAIKFTPKGGSIDVQVERLDERLRLSVRDDGEGIAPSFLPHVFERFRQGDATTTRRHGGLGLGLALVRHLVEAHGGAVTAESEGPGRGSLFTLTLPTVAPGEGPAAPTSDASHLGQAAHPTPPRGALHGISVLVIDDEPDARELVATVLRSEGAEVQVAASADEALERLQERAPTLLVSDLGMPVADGYSLLQRLRREGGLSAGVPAIALTAYTREADRRRALAAGFSSFLSKPIEPGELVRRVAELAHAVARSEP